MSVPSLESIQAAMADRQARSDEYAKYVAIAPIDHGGVRAYNPGDPVPVSNVELHGYLADGLVAEVGTGAAKDATPTVLPRPANSGSLADWQAYARQQGLGDTDLDGLTRDDIAARFPKES